MRTNDGSGRRDLRIALFIDSMDPGGAETVVIDLARGLTERGLKPDVQHFGNTWIENQCRLHNLPHRIVPGRKYFKSFVTLPIFALLYAKFLKNHKIELLHSHLFGAVTGASFSTFLIRLPHLGTIHDVYSIEGKKNRAVLLNVAAKLGTRIVTVSDHMRQYIQAMAKIPRNSIQTFKNGIFLKKFTNDGDKSKRAILGLKQHDLVFICVGRLVPLKGHEVLLKAFSQLDGENRLKLVIVGDGPERSRLEKLSDRLDVNDRVLFLGHRDDVSELLAISDCFVLASRTEGLSCSIIEAMAAGLPIVATNVGGNAELVEHGKSGFLVPSDDSAALAEAMGKLVDNDEVRESFGSHAKIIARSEFSVQNMLEKYIREYLAMVPRGQPPFIKNIETS